MFTSVQSLKDVFCCPEESNFYSYCLEHLILNQDNSPQVMVEFGAGDGTPILNSLMRTGFAGKVHGFELNPASAKVAQENAEKCQLNKQYIIHNLCFFEAYIPEATCLISNPPYLPAIDNDLYQPLLHGGQDGSELARRLLCLNYDQALLMVSSYSHPQGLIEYALKQGYVVENFLISPLPFGFYSSEAKVQEMIQTLRQQGQAFYSGNTYLLAGVLFQKQTQASQDLSPELIRLLTSL